MTEPQPEPQPEGTMFVEKGEPFSGADVPATAPPPHPADEDTHGRHRQPDDPAEVLCECGHRHGPASSAGPVQSEQVIRSVAEYGPGRRRRRQQI